MATEYRLSHTAAEIDRKLSKIDSLVERNELPTKISDLVNDFDFTTESYVKNYAQPKGEYALKSEIPDVPVISVNGKDGDVRLTASDVGALPDTTVIPTVPTNVSAFTNDAGYLTEHQSLAGFATESYVDGKIGEISIPDVAGQVAAHNVSDAAHSDIRDLVDGLTNRLNTLANSDDATLDQMSEVVAYIKSNKTLIENVTTNKVNVSDIIDNLTTNISNKPLSAAQGVVLKGLIDAIVVPVNVSELNNDVGYLTDIPSEYVTDVELDAKGYLTSYVETDPTVPAWAKSETKPVYTASEVGALPNTTHIPSTLSEMVDDSTHRTVSDDEKSAWSAKAEVSDIPTKVSDLENDSGYLTEHQSLDGLATETYVNNQISAAMGEAGEVAQPDWNAAEGENGHILNRPFYTEYGGMTEMPLTGEWSEVDPDMWQYLITAPIGLEVGKTYVVNWNGVDYTVVAKEVIDDPSGAGVPCVGIGNEALLGGTDTGEPFGIMETTAEYAEQFGGMYGLAASIDMSGNIPFTIYANGEVVHKLPVKYLPDGLPYTEGGSNNVILPEFTGSVAGVDDDYINVPGTTPLNIVENEIYTVTWNGTEYKCKAVVVQEDDAEAIILGDVYTLTGGAIGTSATGEPFIIMISPQEYVAEHGVVAQILPFHSVEATLSITGGEIVHKLDNKYLDLDWIPSRKLNIIVPETTVEHFSTSTFFGYDMLNGKLKPFIVIIDGTEYPVSLEGSGNGVDFDYYCGNFNYFDAQNAPDTGEPFVAVIRSNASVFIFFDEKPHQVAIATTVNTIPKDFLPDIAFKSSNIQNGSGIYSLNMLRNSAQGNGSFAIGFDTRSRGQGSFSEGYYTIASGDYSHAEGEFTQANGRVQHVQGKYNVLDTEGRYAHIIGNGGNGGRYYSNAHTIDWSGNAWFAGDVYVGSTSGTNKDEGSKKLVAAPTDMSAGDLLMYDGTNFVKLSKADLIAEIIAALPRAEEASF